MGIYASNIRSIFSLINIEEEHFDQTVKKYIGVVMKMKQLDREEFLNGKVF